MTARGAGCQWFLWVVVGFQVALGLGLRLGLALSLGLAGSFDGAAHHGWRDLILFGALLKVSFCGTAFAHWVIAGIPAMWKPWAIADLVFLILFLWAWWWLYSKYDASSP